MITVIIPSFNSEHTIEKCINSLLNQTYGGDYEIIVVDSSGDRTPEIVSAGYPGVKLIHLDHKTDPGTARNLGISEANGRLIAFIDSDCVAELDWLEKIDAAHQSSYNIVGGAVKVGNAEDDLVGWTGYIAEFRDFIPEQPRREVMHVPTCNISYKREIFWRFGLFEGVYYPQEDLMFNYKAWASGEKILLDPTIQVSHFHRSRLKDFLKHQKTIGASTSRVLKVIPLEGCFIARDRGIAILLLPLLPIIKFVRTLLVYLRLQPRSIVKKPFVILVFALGLAFWTAGFACGVHQERPL